MQELHVTWDKETAEHCGAVGTKQIVSVIVITNNTEIDITRYLNQGKHYTSTNELLNDIDKLNIDIDINNMEVNEY